MISEEIFLKILQKHKEGKTNSEIAKDLNITPNTVQQWINRGKYKNLLRRNYDFKLFETLSDIDFARKYKISRERARQLRMQFAPHTNTFEVSSNASWKHRKENQERNELIKAKILEYIVLNPLNKVINLLEFNKKYFSNQGESVTKSKILKIAKQNNIEVIVKTPRKKIKKESKQSDTTVINNEKYKHGLHCKNVKCYCEIYNLANEINSIKSIKINLNEINYFANEYLQFYKDDDSLSHKDFYYEINKKLFEMQNEQTASQN